MIGPLRRREGVSQNAKVKNGGELIQIAGDLVTHLHYHETGGPIGPSREAGGRSTDTAVGGQDSLSEDPAAVPLPWPGIGRLGWGLHQPSGHRRRLNNSLEAGHASGGLLARRCC